MVTPLGCKVAVKAVLECVQQLLVQEFFMPEEGEEELITTVHRIQLQRWAGLEVGAMAVVVLDLPLHQQPLIRVEVEEVLEVLLAAPMPLVLEALALSLFVTLLTALHLLLQQATLR